VPVVVEPIFTSCRLLFFSFPPDVLVFCLALLIFFDPLFDTLDKPLLLVLSSLWVAKNLESLPGTVVGERPAEASSMGIGCSVECILLSLGFL